jgi:hypothetical protein
VPMINRLYVVEYLKRMNAVAPESMEMMNGALKPGVSSACTDLPKERYVMISNVMHL